MLIHPKVQRSCNVTHRRNDGEISQRVVERVPLDSESNSRDVKLGRNHATSQIYHSSELWKQTYNQMANMLRSRHDMLVRHQVIDA